MMSEITDKLLIAYEDTVPHATIFDLVSGTLEGSTPLENVQNSAISGGNELRFTSDDIRFQVREADFSHYSALVAVGGSPNAEIQWRLDRIGTLLDGVGDYWDTPYTADLYPAEIDAEAWIYPIQDQLGNIISAGDNSGWRFRYTVGGGIGLLDQGGTNTLNTSNGLLSLNSWHHVRITGGSSGLSIWIDGVKQASGGSPYTAPHPLDPLAVGAQTGGIEALGGRISEIRIWSRVRSDAEFLSSWNRSLPQGGLPGLITRWGFVEQTGSTSVDTTGKGHTLTARGGATWVKSQVWNSGLVSAFDFSRPSLGTKGEVWPVGGHHIFAFPSNFGTEMDVYYNPGSDPSSKSIGVLRAGRFLQFSIGSQISIQRTMTYPRKLSIPIVEPSLNSFKVQSMLTQIGDGKPVLIIPLPDRSDTWGTEAIYARFLRSQTPKAELVMSPRDERYTLEFEEV